MNTIQEIIQNHILGEIFSEFPTDLNNAFQFFLEADVDQTTFVGDSSLGEEWGYTVAEAYGLDDIRAIRGLMQSMYNDLEIFKSALFQHASHTVQINKDETSDGIQYDIEAHANLGIIEHIDSDCKYNMDDYSIKDVEKVDERISASLDLTAFNIARFGKDELYAMAEQAFVGVGLTLEILEMEMIPTEIEEHSVKYDCIPTDYRRVFADESYVHMKDGKKIGGNFDE